MRSSAAARFQGRGVSDTVERVRRLAFALSGCVALLRATPAVAQGQPSATLPADAQIDISVRPPEPGATPGSREDDSGNTGPEPASLGEAPPPPLPPRHKGLVLESTLGVLGFVGKFRHVAPPAYWTHGLLGYEILSWLMVFGEGELAFTDTGESQDPSHARAFPLWGFGGGARATVHLGGVGLFLQGDVGALTADVPHDALTYLGFPGAGTLGAEYGGRVGIEWYQRDRHLALIAQGGPRIAQGFSKFGSSADLPLMWDAAGGLRYTF
jgi:hypothetical protein